MRGLMQEGICREGEIFYVPSRCWHRAHSTVSHVKKKAADRAKISCHQPRRNRRFDTKLCRRARVGQCFVFYEAQWVS